MKKVLSLVLVIAMVLSSMSFAFASPLTDIADNDYEDAINTLVGLGIIDGYEDGTFRPERTVTRAQMAKMLVITLGYGDLVAGSKSNFADTQGHWADAYIALASGQGLVIGYPNGTFQPDKTIAYDEVMTMVVRSLGYTDGCNEIVGTWPTNYKIKAAQLGLTDDVKLLAVGADRGGVAQLLKNALSAVLVKVDTDGDVSYVKGVDKDSKEYTKKLLSRLATMKDLAVSATNVDVDHKDYKGDIVDLTPYMFQDIVVYENKDGDVVYVDDVKSLVFEGTVTDATATSITVENDDDEYEFKTTSGTSIQFMYNGKDASRDYTSNLVKDAKVTVILVGESGDKIADNIEVNGIIAEKVSGYVQVEEEYVDGELVFDVLYLPEDDDEVDFANLTITGDATSLEDIQEDDVISVFVPLDDGTDEYFDKEAADKMKIVVSRNTVEGKVTKIDSDEAFIAGVGYEFSLGALVTLGTDVEVTTEGTFYLDHEGKIFDVKDVSEVTAKDYAIVVEINNGYKANSTVSGVTLADPKVKLLTASGEKITYEFDLTQETGSDVAISDLLILTTSIAEGDLVKYNVNKDKEIDKIEKETLSKDDGIFTTGNSFNLANNAVIFSLPNGLTNTEDAKVVSVDELDTEIDGYVIYDGSKIVAVVAITGVGVEDKVYAIITNSKDKGIYDPDEDEAVASYTTYVDGIKVEYMGTSETADTTLDTIVELKLKDGKIETVATVTDKYADGDVKVVTGTALNARVNNVINDKHFLADDVVIYVLDKDGEFDKVGTKSDIRNNEFVAYNFDSDDNNDFDVVVVKLK